MDSNEGKSWVVVEDGRELEFQTSFSCPASPEDAKGKCCMFPSKTAIQAQSHISTPISRGWQQKKNDKQYTTCPNFGNFFPWRVLGFWWNLVLSWHFTLWESSSWLCPTLCVAQQSTDSLTTIWLLKLLKIKAILYSFSFSSLKKRCSITPSSQYKLSNLLRLRHCAWHWTPRLCHFGFLHYFVLKMGYFLWSWQKKKGGKKRP